MRAIPDHDIDWDNAVESSNAAMEGLRFVALVSKYNGVMQNRAVIQRGLTCAAVGAQVSLRDVISSTVEMVAADATKKGLDLAYTMDDALLNRTVLGDAIRIRQVRQPQSRMMSSCIGRICTAMIEVSARPDREESGTMLQTCSVRTALGHPVCDILS